MHLIPLFQLIISTCVVPLYMSPIRDSMISTCQEGIYSDVHQLSSIHMISHVGFVELCLRAAWHQTGKFYSIPS